jgi:hypothetical protein
MGDLGKNIDEKVLFGTCMLVAWIMDSLVVISVWMARKDSMEILQVRTTRKDHLAIKIHMAKKSGEDGA